MNQQKLNSSLTAQTGLQGNLLPTSNHGSQVYLPAKYKQGSVTGSLKQGGSGISQSKKAVR